MEIAFQFNMPPQQDKTMVRFGETNPADAARKFRIGTIDPDETPLGVHWSLLDWIDGNDEAKLRELELEVQRGHIVRVERQDENGQVQFFEVDTGANWPASAYGTNAILSAWSFED